jgi:hypothetical protein
MPAGGAASPVLLPLLLAELGALLPLPPPPPLPAELPPPLQQLPPPAAAPALPR